MTRKAVQIAVATAKRKGSYDPSTETLYALCDDGSIWKTIGLNPSEQQGWELCPAIPQRVLRELP